MANTAITIAETHALERVQTPLAFTPEQEQLIRDTFASGANKQEFQVLLEISRARRLNPLLRQIHFVKRWDGQKGREVWSTQVSIDGLRAIAERTGKYDGQDEAELGPPNPDGFPSWARVKVYRKDWTRAAVGTAHWDEYVQTKKDGSVTHMWRQMPRVMLAKCAESIALRKAFPEDMSGLYTAEEMGQAESARPTRITPHANSDEDLDAPPVEGGPFESIMAQLVDIESRMATAAKYGDVLALRAALGSKAQPTSAVCKAMQECREAQTANVDQRKALSKVWQRLDRQLAKLEAKLTPSVEDSFIDGDHDPETGEMREPGED